MDDNIILKLDVFALFFMTSIARILVEMVVLCVDLLRKLAQAVHSKVTSALLEYLFYSIAATLTYQSLNAQVCRSFDFKFMMSVFTHMFALLYSITRHLPADVDTKKARDAVLFYGASIFAIGSLFFQNNVLELIARILQYHALHNHIKHLPLVILTFALVGYVWSPLYFSLAQTWTVCNIVWHIWEL